jgi:hypothetical protein
MALDLGAIGSKLLGPSSLYMFVIRMMKGKQEQLSYSLIFLWLNQSGAEG